MPRRTVIGQSDFRQFRTQGGQYVDKSVFLEELLNDSYAVTVFTRPRRFGKTLNLSTLRYFLEKSEEDRRYLFEDLRIWQSEEAREHYQKYPVIWISFKDIKGQDWPSTFASIRSTIEELYSSHRYLLKTGVLEAEEAERFTTIFRHQGDEELHRRALYSLSSMLVRQYGQPVVILIDDYDTPIHSGFDHGYYDSVVTFFRSLFGKGLKDNPWLYRGVLTGILRVSKESLFF
jgi:hypothetical protein